MFHLSEGLSRNQGCEPVCVEAVLESFSSLCWQRCLLVPKRMRPEHGPPEGQTIRAFLDKLLGPFLSGRMPGAPTDVSGIGRSSSRGDVAQFPWG